MKDLILRSYQIAHKRKWDKLYIAVDIHDVTLEANYSKGIPTTFLSNAKEVLQRLTQRKDIVLLLYTCSFPAEIVQYLEFFKSHGIEFKYVNENPDAPNTAFGCFDKKFYYNILLEDKAGFDHKKDWAEIDEALNIIDQSHIGEIAKCSAPQFWYKNNIGDLYIVHPHPLALLNADHYLDIAQEVMFDKQDIKIHSKFDLTLNAPR